MSKRKPPVKETPVPVVVYKPGPVPIYYLLVEESFEAVRALYHPVVMPGVTYGVYDCTILNDYLPGGKAPRYHGTDRPLQSVLEDLRASLLAHGGTPEAVRLMFSLGQLTEEDIIVAKAKLAKTPAADAAPAKGKGKGNTAALEKARAARAEAGPDTRKVKILNKENPYRAESGRATAFNAILGAKTVEDYEKAGGKRKYLSRWVEEGRISLT